MEDDGENAKERVKIHTPYIICNDMMYNTWKEIAERVPDFSIMTNSVANNGNPFGSADYARNRNRILNTGIDIWEYEGGYSYHGKSILIDDDLSVIGSFNMDMRSTYLDTELTLLCQFNWLYIKRITIGSIFQYLSGHSFIFHHAFFQQWKSVWFC